MSCPFNVVFREDSTITLLARITARGGSGAATGVDGEGRWLQRADIESIGVKVFDISGDAPASPVYENAALTVADVVLDTPVTSYEIWTQDGVGYNFLHDLPPAAFPEGDRECVVEYRIELADGSVHHGVFQGPVLNLLSS